MKLHDIRPRARRALARATNRLRCARGQATVEYVGLAVAVAVLLVSMGSGLNGQGGKIGSAVAKRLTQAIESQG